MEGMRAYWHVVVSVIVSYVDHDVDINIDVVDVHVNVVEINVEIIEVGGKALSACSPTSEVGCGENGKWSKKCLNTIPNIFLIS